MLHSSEGLQAWTCSPEPSRKELSPACPSCTNQWFYLALNLQLCLWPTSQDSYQATERVQSFAVWVFLSSQKSCLGPFWLRELKKLIKSLFQNTAHTVTYDTRFDTYLSSFDFFVTSSYTRIKLGNENSFIIFSCSSLTAPFIPFWIGNYLIRLLEDYSGRKLQYKS